MREVLLTGQNRDGPYFLNQLQNPDTYQKKRASHTIKDNIVEVPHFIILQTMVSKFGLSLTHRKCYGCRACSLSKDPKFALTILKSHKS